jgi:hypothetical protein
VWALLESKSGLDCSITNNERIFQSKKAVTFALLNLEKLSFIYPDVGPGSFDRQVARHRLFKNIWVHGLIKPKQ